MEKIKNLIVDLYNVGYFINNPHFLLLTDIPTNEYLIKDKISTNLKDKQMYIFATSPYNDTKLNTNFNIIYPNQTVNNWEDTSVSLKYISVNRNYEIDYIPQGYSALCLFEFIGEKPDILKKLAYYNVKKNFEINDYLILTNKNLLEKIL